MTLPTVLVAGGTGLVGGHLVRELVADDRVGRVVTPVRRATSNPAGTSRVEAPVVDFDALHESAELFEAAQAFICLGTTIKQAGSREAFRRVDFDYALHTARLAVDGGAREAFLVSSVGADAASRVFYSRVKGEIEAAVSALPFASVYIFRPSLLVGARVESRPGERVGAAFGRLVAPLMVGPARRYRPIEALTVARAMASVARKPLPGVHIVESEDIARIGASGYPA
jgi:uncharacterized protein YbjT (DUF2867 family)